MTPDRAGETPPMPRLDAHPDEVASPRRYRWDTPEFARVATLSDGVFAIALTLLVLTLDVPDVAAAELAGALLAEVQQVAVFALSFLLVANIWWVHHRLFALLGEVDSGLIAVNLALLGLVALVPFPTNLVGLHPNAPAAVVPFIGVFLGITLLYLVALLRARRLEAWRVPVPRGLFPWMVGGWVLHASGMLAALLVALWWPIAGLVILTLSGPTLEIVTTRLAPRSYNNWAP